jgi:hypothetical protein
MKNWHGFPKLLMNSLLSEKSSLKMFSNVDTLLYILHTHTVTFHRSLLSEFRTTRRNVINERKEKCFKWEGNRNYSGSFYFPCAILQLSFLYRFISITLKDWENLLRKFVRK